MAFKAGSSRREVATFLVIRACHKVYRTIRYIVARAKTPSFIAEFPLRTTPADQRALGVRLEAARNLYNAVLGEALRRLELMRQSKAWQAARALPALVDSKPNPTRSEAFQAAADRFAFNAGSLQKFAEQCRDACWIGEHLGSHDAQTAGLRAFRAVRQYGFGKRGRPRFKPFEGLDSIEGKGQAVIRYKPQPTPAVHYRGLVLPLVLDLRDPGGWQKAALGSRVKYVRILRREIRGKVRWYTQLILEGAPPAKGRVAPHGAVGLDVGPSSVAVVGAKEAFLEPLCPTIVQPWQEIRRLERGLDRSRRATNPENFNQDGTVRKGAKDWTRSGRYQRLARARKETERRLAGERKRAHGQLANRILSLGNVVKAEELSYRSFQRCFGRSVKVRAPGMFVEMLKRKTKAAGGRFVEIAPKSTRLSQFDHTTSAYVKKPLNQRSHVFGDGVTEPVQRDLYSAFLASCCDAETLDVRQVHRAWPGAEPLLRRAIARVNQPASGEGSAFAHGAAPVGVGRPSKEQIQPPRGCGGVA
jgi:putative transposase